MRPCIPATAFIAVVSLFVLFSVYAPVVTNTPSATVPPAEPASGDIPPSSEWETQAGKVGKGVSSRPPSNEQEGDGVVLLRQGTFRGTGTTFITEPTVSGETPSGLTAATGSAASGRWIYAIRMNDSVVIDVAPMEGDAVEHRHPRDDGADTRDDDAESKRRSNVADNTGGDQRQEEDAALKESKPPIAPNKKKASVASSSVESRHTPRYFSFAAGVTRVIIEVGTNDEPELTPLVRSRADTALIAFEPQPPIFTKMLAKFPNRDRLIAVPAAVTPHIGRVPMHISAHAGCSSLLPMNARASQFAHAAKRNAVKKSQVVQLRTVEFCTRSESKIDVPSLPLSEIIGRVPPHINIELLVTDAQGMDTHVISTMSVEQSDRIPLLILECQDLQPGHVLYLVAGAPNCASQQQCVEQRFPHRLMQCWDNAPKVRELNCMYAHPDLVDFAELSKFFGPSGSFATGALGYPTPRIGRGVVDGPRAARSSTLRGVGYSGGGDKMKSLPKGLKVLGLKNITYAPLKDFKCSF